MVISGKEKLLGIQYLRAIAALMVATYHIPAQVPGYGAMLNHAWIDAGQLRAGVDIFFVISGFIMMTTGRELSGNAFLRRRIARIVPLYWFMTLLLVVIALLVPSLLRSTNVTLGATLGSLFFIPYHGTAQVHFLSPLLAPGWTLNIEMYFYVIFALTLAARRYQLAICGLWFACGSLAFGFLIPHLSIAGFYTQPRVLEFWLGMALGAWHANHRARVAPAIAAVLAAAAYAILLRNPLQLSTDGLIASGFPAMIIVACVVEIERRGALPEVPILGLLGDASYSIYLTHMFTLGVLRTLWVHLPALERLGDIAFMLIAITALSVAGVGAYQWIERPLTRLARHFLTGSAERGAPVAVA